MDFIKQLSSVVDNTKEFN